GVSDDRAGGEPVSLRDADAAHRRAGGSVPRAEARDSSQTGRAVWHPERRPGHHHDAAQFHHAAGHGGPHHPARYGVYSVPLAGGSQRQPVDTSHARPAQQDPGIQGIRLPPGEGRRRPRLMFGMEFYVDPSRCIGCQSCVKACEECETHRGVSMINFDFVDRADTIATAAYVCWHCENPTCAQVCPADAIKKYEDGIVGSSLKPRCIACSNCVLACPFGIPKLVPEYEQMMKCDMCYDRTSVGKRPMCATVCPSQALAYVTPEEIALRREKPVNTVQFGNQRVVTKVFLMSSLGEDLVLDAADYIWE